MTNKINPSPYPKTQTCSYPDKSQSNLVVDEKDYVISLEQQKEEIQKINNFFRKLERERFKQKGCLGDCVIL
jgi:hypothetical protein